VHTLGAEGYAVMAVSRSSDRLAVLANESPNGASSRVMGIVADYANVPEFTRALQDTVALAGPFDACMFYGPDAPQAALAAAYRVVTGPFVLLLTSSFATPDRRQDRSTYPKPAGSDAHRLHYLLLGWHRGEHSTRWHTPAEVSVAALHVLDRREDNILGAIRPWVQRPRG
jgi:hypothetical protein